MNELDYHLRDDNAALSTKGLSASQVEASIKILKFMSNALETSIRSLPYCNNRVLFVSGERGSGKSSMIRSLQTALTDMRMYARDKKFSDLRQGAGKQDNSSDNLLFHDTVEGKRGYLENQLLHHVRDHGWHERVRWLPPLSLDPLPLGTNLVGALLSRIQDTVALESSEETVRGGSMMHASAQLERVRHSLDNLKTDALMAYESNIDRASAYQEPENNALQAGHAELKKLGILRRLDQALEYYFNAASDAQELRKVNRGMFIQIIDDIDSRPSRAIEALKLAHSFSVPRILFVIIGEQHAIDRMMYFDVKGEFEKVTSSHDPETNKDIAAVANEQSSSLFRKLIPLGQRINVEDMTLDESLNFRVETTEDENVGQRNSRDLDGNLINTLAAQLDQCGLSSAEMSFLSPAPPDATADAGQSSEQDIPWSLCDLLTCDLRAYSMLSDLRYGGREQKEVEDKALAASARSNHAIQHELLKLPTAYDGAHLLTSPPRQVSDFSHILEGISTGGSDEQKQKKNYIKLLDENLKRLIDEDGPLGRERQDQLSRCLHENGSGWVFEAPSLTARPHIADRISIQPQDSKFGEDADIRLSLASAEYWEIDIPQPGGKPGVADFQPLGNRTRPAYKLLHDAVLLSGAGVCTKRLDIRCKGRDHLAQLSILKDDGEITIPLLTCTWMTFWHLDQFSALWDAGLERLHRMRLDRSDINPEEEFQLAMAYWCYSLLLVALAGVPETLEYSKSEPRLTLAIRESDHHKKWTISKEMFRKNEKTRTVNSMLEDLTDKCINHLKKKMERGEDDINRIHVASALINIIYLDSVVRDIFKDQPKGNKRNNPDKNELITIPWLTSCADMIENCISAESPKDDSHYSKQAKFALEAAIVRMPRGAAQSEVPNYLEEQRESLKPAIRRLRRRQEHHAQRST